MADFYWRVQYLLTPTIGNPDDFDLTRSPAYCQFTTTVSCPFEQTFQDGFSPVSYSCCSSHSDTVILLIFVIVSENSTELTSFHCVVRFVVVVAVHLRRLTVPSFSLFPKIRRFWRHLSHRSLCFVFPVLLSSFTPATVSHFCRYWRH
jgi:hypothetical protein